MLSTHGLTNTRAFREMSAESVRRYATLHNLALEYDDSGQSNAPNLAPPLVFPAPREKDADWIPDEASACPTLRPRVLDLVRTLSGVLHSEFGMPVIWNHSLPDMSTKTLFLITDELSVPRAGGQGGGDANPSASPPTPDLTWVEEVREWLLELEAFMRGHLSDRPLRLGQWDTWRSTPEHCIPPLARVRARLANALYFLQLMRVDRYNEQLRVAQRIVSQTKGRCVLDEFVGHLLSERLSLDMTASALKPHMDALGYTAAGEPVSLTKNEVCLIVRDALAELVSGPVARWTPDMWPETLSMDFHALHMLRKEFALLVRVLSVGALLRMRILRCSNAEERKLHEKRVDKFMANATHTSDITREASLINNGSPLGGGQRQMDGFVHLTLLDILKVGVVSNVIVPSPDFSRMQRVEKVLYHFQHERAVPLFTPALKQRVEVMAGLFRFVVDGHLKVFLPVYRRIVEDILWSSDGSYSNDRLVQRLKEDLSHGPTSPIKSGGWIRSVMTRLTTSLTRRSETPLVPPSPSFALFLSVPDTFPYAAAVEYDAGGVRVKKVEGEEEAAEREGVFRRFWLAGWRWIRG